MSPAHEETRDGKEKKDDNDHGHKRSNRKNTKEHKGRTNGRRNIDPYKAD